MKIKGLLVLVAAASTAASAMFGTPIGGLDAMPPEACFAPGTPQDVVRTHARRRAARISSLQANPGFQFSDTARWGTTATDGSGLTQGQVTTLTWNIVADGTPIGALGGIAGESTAPSSLKAFLNGIYGSEAVWITHFQSIFDQWSAITGITYVKVNVDDGASLATAAGLTGVRADIRIGGHFIDGPSNVLAYNFFPNNGDMVVDTGDTFYNDTSNSSQKLINVLAHEHGHGMGINHSCPVNATKLMEPFVNTAFTHAQLDDKLAGWRGYGDDKENNETSATASNLGSLSNGTTTVGDLSADDDSDVDFYKFTVAAGKRAAVTVTPIGTTYLAGPQVGGSCTAGTSFNALAVNDLGVELRGTDGTTILATANDFAAGTAETISSTALGGAGTFFVRTFAGAVNNVQGYQLQVTISDDVGTFLAINNVTMSEGTGGTTNATFTVTRSGVTTNAVSVSALTANVTAVAPSDYTTTGPTTLNFGSGVLTQTFSVPVQGDTTDEGTETFVVNLSSPSGATIADGVGVGTINDDDAPPTISINDATVTEGNSGSINATFTATLSAASGQTVTVNHATADNTAVSGLTQSAAAITIPSSGNASPYPSSITVSGAGTVVKATVSLNSFTHTFPQDVDVLLVGPAGQKIVLMSDVGGSADVSGATLTFDDAAAGNLTSGAISAGTFKPTNLDDNEPSGGDVWGSPAPASPYGSALSAFIGTNPNGAWTLFVVDDVAGDSGSFAGGWTLTLSTTTSDYTSVSGTLTFAPGELTKTINVPVLGDVVTESNETFFVNLSSPTNATLADGQGQGTITNDDGAVLPTLSINNVTVTEGNAGTTNAGFTVTLSAASASTVTVTAQTANSTATAPGDYTATGPTVLTFNPGDLTKTFSVPVVGDLLDEVNETYFVNLTSPTNATISDNQGIGTITDDDAQPTLSINNVAVTEGNAGPVVVGFTVTLSAASGQTVTVSAATANNTAAAPGDYTAVGATTLTFNPGVTTQTFNVNAQGDSLDETNETFFVNLSAATNAGISDNQGLGTINDDDAQPTLSINNVAVTEGNAGPVVVGFTVTLSAASGQTVTVSAATANNTAIAPGDYTAVGATTLTFNPGVTTQTFNVNAIGDTLDELNETFFVNLSGATNAGFTDNQGTGTINDDDAPPTIAINNVTVTEGNAGPVAAGFTVTLSAASSQTVTVSAATANNTAIAPGDYTAVGATTLTFNPGVTTQSFNVNVQGDLLTEGTETFFVNLSAPSNATISDNQGIGTITDDEGPPSLSINDVTVTEGNAGTTDAVFTATLSAASGGTVTVSAQTSNLTATAGADYTATGPTVLTFNPGDLTKTFTVPVLGDVAVEGHETFQVTLSSPTNATIADGTGIGEILDNELAARSFVSEGGSDANDCTLQTTPCRNISAAIAQVFVDGEIVVLTPGEYETAPLTITHGVKITSPSGTVAFVRQPITINAPGYRVVLRGLTLKGNGTGNGITLTAADSVSIEETTIDAWAAGVKLNNPSPVRVFVLDSVLRNNSSGLDDADAVGSNVMAIGESRFEGNNFGLAIEAGRVQVRDSAFVGNPTSGIIVGETGVVEVHRSDFRLNGAAVMTVTGGTARVGRSHVFGNDVGFFALAGTFQTFGTNILRGNLVNTSGTITTVPEQ